jgi:hypothetical protein
MTTTRWGVLVSAILLLGCDGSVGGAAALEGGADSTASSDAQEDAGGDSADTGTSFDASPEASSGTPDATLTGDAAADGAGDATADGADGSSGLPLDASTGGDVPFTAPPAQLCEAVWMQPDAGSSGATLTNPSEVQLAVDATNDIYLAVTYEASQLALGDAGPTAAPQGVVLVKLDANCNQLWVRTLGVVGDTGGATSSVTNYAIGVDSDSSVTIGGAFSGSVDFGGGFVFNGDVDGAPVLSKGYLVRYDASGTLVFRDLLLPAAAVRGVLYSAFASVVDMTVAPDGVSTALVAALGDVDFGVPAPDAGAVQDPQNYDAGFNGIPAPRLLVQFDSQGRVLGIPQAAQDDFQQIASGTDGTLWAWSSLTSDGGTLPPGLSQLGPDGGVAAPYLVHMSPSADPLWVRPLSTGLSSFTAGAPGAVVLTYPGLQNPVPSYEAELQAFSPDGGSPYTSSTMLPAGSSLPGGAPVAVASDGTVYAGGLGIGAAGTGPDSAATWPEIGYATADSTGHFVSRTVWTDGQLNDLRALAVDGAGNLIVAGSTSGQFGVLSRLFVVKLAR